MEQLASRGHQVLVEGLLVEAVGEAVAHGEGARRELLLAERGDEPVHPRHARQLRSSQRDLVGLHRVARTAERKSRPSTLACCRALRSGLGQGVQVAPDHAAHVLGRGHVGLGEGSGQSERRAVPGDVAPVAQELHEAVQEEGLTLGAAAPGAARGRPGSGGERRWRRGRPRCPSPSGVRGGSPGRGDGGRAGRGTSPAFVRSRSASRRVTTISMRWRGMRPPR